MTKIILASQSNQRKELLSDMGIVFDVMPGNYDEQPDATSDPADIAEKHAVGKAMIIAREFPSAVVIAADTIVTLEGKRLEKPSSPENFAKTLKLLAGKTHEVTTGMAVICLHEGFYLVDSDSTKVTFKPYDEQAVRDYVTAGKWKNQAGVYDIRSAAPLIAGLEGSIHTVLGLSTTNLAEMLMMVGIHAAPID